MSTSIEYASARDLDILYEIEKECFGKEAFSRNQIDQLLTDYNSIGLIARKGKNIVGFVIGMVYADAVLPTGHILTIDVSPKQRRQGIGRTLLLELETIFKDRGVKTIHLEVRESNMAAINLYQKLGYRRSTKLHFYYGDSHGFHFKKVLA